MLSLFCVKSTFYNVRASLVVDCEQKTADLTMTISNRIHRMDSLSFHSVNTVEKAESFLRQDMGELGTFMERYHHLYSRDFTVAA